jgi:outer membrane protein TolC
MQLTTSAFAAAAACALIAAAPEAQQSAPPGQAYTLTLTEAIDIAQRQGLPARVARHTLDAARASYTAYRARQLPQLFLSGDIPSYNRSIIAAPQPDGSLQFRPQQLTSSSVSAVVTQNIPYTGGAISLSSQLAQLKRTGAPETWSSTPFSVSLAQPILRSNDLKWDRTEQALNAELAERMYDESLEDIAGATAVAFINLHSAGAALESARENLARNATLRDKVNVRYRIGGVSRLDASQVELAHLRAQQALSQAELARDEADATLRAALGLPAAAPLTLVLPGIPPATDPDTSTAIAAALRDRSDGVRAELDDARARRAASRARFDGGLGAMLTASYGYNATGGVVGDVYQDLQDRQAFRLNVSFPVWQWGAGSADVEAAQAARAASQAAAQNTREQIRRDVVFTLRRLAQARQNLVLAAQADSLAAASLEDAIVRYDFGSMQLENLFIVMNNRELAAQSRIASLAGLWTEFYRLRRATMHDFEAGRPIR